VWQLWQRSCAATGARSWWQLAQVFTPVLVKSWVEWQSTHRSCFPAAIAVAGTPVWQVRQRREAAIDWSCDSWQSRQVVAPATARVP
jgi:hypothetical protein